MSGRARTMHAPGAANVSAAPLDVLLLYNEPLLSPDDPDYAAEAGVRESVEAVSEALAARGHRARTLGVGASVEEFLQRLPHLGPADVIFNLFEGFGGVGRSEAEITGLLELLGYPLTGSGAECLGLVRHKARTKWLLAGAGIATAPFVLVAADAPVDQEAVAALLATGPAIVKPAHEDASQGIGNESICTGRAALLEQVDKIRSRYGAVLVEQFIVGREFNAAVLALGEPECLPLAEIEFGGPEPSGWQIVTYDAKWAIGSAADRATPPRCPAKVDAALAREIGNVALAAFRLTGCRDYARVDMRMDEAGRVYVLEVNGNPDIGPSAGFARALDVAGIGYDEFIDRLVRHAATRRTASTHAG